MMQNTYKKLNNLVGWLVFAIATVVYLSTIEPTTSFWDCGEYIATAFKLEVGHPPGAPLFLLIANIFSNFAFGDVENVAYMVNLMSGLSSSFTILFLFWTITALAKKLIKKPIEEMNKGQLWAILGSGAVGALCYTFSDSFWFSAVEGEVYAMSALFSAIVFWSILKWEQSFGEAGNNRWIIFISFMIGLSIGVHMLNLLAIPAIVFVYYFKNNEGKKISVLNFLYINALSIGLLGLIFYMLIPQIVNLAGKIELIFVNDIGLPFNSGTIFFFALLIGAIVYGLQYTKKTGHFNYNTTLLSLTFLLIGYSMFFVLIIRSNANTPIDENNPENAVSLLAYLNREQYGETPLVSGHYFNSKVQSIEDGKPVYEKSEKKGKYVIKDSRKGTKRVYSKASTGLFPRMHSSKSQHVREYKKWSGFDGPKDRKPSVGENVRYLIDYQFNFMYFRYFMWNFVGRQNNMQGHGNVTNGNWISGIPFVDEARLGPQDDLPRKYKDNPARNTYFFLPLILGLIGLLYHYKNNDKDAWIVTLLFLLTGAAIVIYLNQHPLQPRERDYAYAGSFYAFAIWVGLGVYAIWDFIAKKTQSQPMAILTSVVCLVAVPGLMASQNWDDHDRSGRYTGRDFALNYLESCDENAILFTMGDNDTFPLWYVQEVEEKRTDVRIVNLSLLNTDWYIDQMKRDAYDGEGVPISMDYDLYKQGTRDFAIHAKPINKRVDVDKMNDFLKSDKEFTKVRLQRGMSVNYFPSKKISIPVDKQKVIASGLVEPEDHHRILDTLEWDINMDQLEKRHLAILDMIATNDWDRPIYFAITIGNSAKDFMFLDKFFQLDGLVYKFVPILNREDETQGQMGRVNSNKLNENLMKYTWGRMEKDDVMLDETNLRLIMNFRNIFGRLASKLIEEGENEQAIEVMDQLIAVTPSNKIPHSLYSIPLAENYYIAGATEKARALAFEILQDYADELRYYESMPTRKRASLKSETRRANYFLQSVGRMINSYDPDQKARLTEVLASIKK